MMLQARQGRGVGWDCGWGIDEFYDFIFIVLWIYEILQSQFSIAGRFSHDGTRAMGERSSLTPNSRNYVVLLYYY